MRRQHFELKCKKTLRDAQDRKSRRIENILIVSHKNRIYDLKYESVSSTEALSQMHKHTRSQAESNSDQFCVFFFLSELSFKSLLH